jgi:hypothetical protein
MTAATITAARAAYEAAAANMRADSTARERNVMGFAAMQLGMAEAATDPASAAMRAEMAIEHVASYWDLYRAYRAN